MKLVAYARVSTPAQAREGLGLEIQRRAMRSWAKANHHRIVSWAIDAGVSGANGVDTREALQEAVGLVKAGKAEGVLTYNLDRLARLLHVQEGILGQVWASGGRVFTVEDGEVLEDDPDDPQRTAMRQMRGVFSQLERSTIVNRMKKGRRLKKDQGGYAGGRPPFGYRAEGKSLVPDPAEQKVIARIRKLRAQGKSLREIATALEDEQIKPRHGGHWSPEGLRKILAR